MTELTITPKTADKTARFRGAVAAGEHVAVTIKGGAAWLGDGNGEHLSLRVLDLVTGRTLAVFPRPPETYEDGDEPEEQDEWDTAGEDDADLFCNLNLNTDRMVNAARHMLRVPVLFVLGAKDEDNPATTRTLYFRDRYIVEFWPERVGDDTPYDLDKWPKQIDEWTELIDGWTTQMSNMKVQATPVSNGLSVLVWDGTGTQPQPTVITNGQDGAPGEVQFTDLNERCVLLAGGTESESPTNVMSGQINFPISGSNQSIGPGSGGVTVTDGTKSYEFTASGNPTGNNTVARLSDVATRYEKPQGGIPKTDLAAAVQTSLGKADTALQEHQSLAAYVNGGVYDGDAKKILLKHDNATVAAIDATAFIRDGMISEVKIVGDNLVVVFNADAGKESISIPLTQIFNPANYYDKTAADAKFLALSGGTMTGSLVFGPYGPVVDVEDVYSLKLTFANGNTVLIPMPPNGNAEALTTQNVGINSSVSGSTVTIGDFSFTIPDAPSASAAAPLMDGTASPGTSAAYARGDHRHPTDTSRASQDDLDEFETNIMDTIDEGVRYPLVSASIPAPVPRVPAALFPILYYAPQTATAYTISGADGVRYEDDGNYVFVFDVATDHLVLMAYSGATTALYANTHLYDEARGVTNVSVADGAGRANVAVGTTILEYAADGDYELADRTGNSIVAADGDSSATLMLPPRALADYMRDLLVDVDNSANSSDLGLEFAGDATAYIDAGGAYYLVAVADGDDLADLTTVEAGARARYYITETAQTATPTGGTEAVPVISLQRLTITVGGAAS